MKYLSIIFLICTLFIFSACNNLRQLGGQGQIQLNETTTVLDDKGKPTSIVQKQTSLDLAQPDTPSSDGQIEFKQDPKGNVTIGITTGKAHNNAEIIGTLNLLNIPMYAGVGLILLGVGLFFFAPNKQWAIAIGVVGGIMIGGSYLLAKYSAYFMIGLLILLGYGVYLVKDYILERRANQENVKLIDTLKTSNAIDVSKLNTTAKVIQSNSTKRKVDRIQGKK